MLSAVKAILGFFANALHAGNGHIIVYFIGDG